MTDIEAFEHFGMDAAIMCWPLDRAVMDSADWRVEGTVLRSEPEMRIRHTITTPEGGAFVHYRSHADDGLCGRAPSEESG